MAINQGCASVGCIVSCNKRNGAARFLNYHKEALHLFRCFIDSFRCLCETEDATRHAGFRSGRAGLGTHNKPIVTVAALFVVHRTLCDWGDVMVGSCVMNIGKRLHLCTSFVPFLDKGSNILFQVLQDRALCRHPY